jgi:GDSL-like Lipase/Acylhydrolase family
MDLLTSGLGRGARLATVIAGLVLCGGGRLASAESLSGPVRPDTLGVAVDADTASASFQAAFLGDSYTYGVGATRPSEGYAYLVAEAEHWNADVVGLPGSGYVRIATHDNMDISAGIAPVIAVQPKVVIVECGRNDIDDGINLADVEPRALKDLRALRAGLPHATIVVLGPIWLSGHPGPRAFAVRDAVYAAQRQIPGSRWIDPIAERWFTGRLGHKTGDDATMINWAVSHPDNLGYRHIAYRLETDLRLLGLN